MNVKDINSHGRRILGHATPINDLKSAPTRWLARVGYLSLFAGAVSLVYSLPRETAAAETAKGDPPRTGRRPPFIFAPRPGPSGPTFMRRQSDFRLPHQKAALAGGDNCPGTAVPPGNYTVQSPYTDSGDTTNGNNTIHNFDGGYYYSYSGGPDHIYSFTITGVGANPNIEVSTSSSNYDLMIYVLNGLTGRRCPTGVANNVYASVVRENYTPGATESLGSDGIQALPLNVPLHLVIDSRFYSSAAQSHGPYTVKFQDLTIGPTANPPANDAPLDMDGDGRSDFVVARNNAGQTTWYTRGGNDTFPQPVNWGAPGDVFVPAHFDPDGKVDHAVWRPGSQGRFYIIRSQTQTLQVEDFGQTGDDATITADYTGDGLADLAVYRPAAVPGATAYWHIRSLVPGGQYTVTPFGEYGDTPTPGHYYTYNMMDLAVRNTTGPAGYFKLHPWWGEVYFISIGSPSDTVVPGDFDGDGLDDFAVVRVGQDGLYVWDYWSSGAYTNGFYRNVWGVAATDILTPGDHDGDGRTEFSVWRPGNPGTFYQKAPNTGSVRTVSWGQTGDIPVANSSVR